ncbi:two-component sensor histidine kinase [Massilia dura]|uniref:histidine kinase n=1 Tax=Pseudoduganella dura TaxID=321982 RepID=A0A6I3XI05_9BURK|nr:ATP-binding protein [Pseudoduganella dura]MUI16109.1 two-component sensor histidine kinase [Pseudoduganella dura]GGY11769.1 two-component sensor histidine kinase [Pseudoduganella dura]
MPATLRVTLLKAAIVLLTAAIFALDAFTSMDSAIAVMYVVVVLATVHVWPRRILAVTALCLVLTLAAHMVTGWFGVLNSSLARCAVSLAAIGIGGYLAHVGAQATSRLLQREESLRDSRMQLAHVTRVTTLGELAASIAHEVNQPLAAISANGEAALRWLRRQPPDPLEVEHALQRMLADTCRASEVIRRIRALARRSEATFAPVDLAGIVHDCAALLQRELASHGATLMVDIAERLPPVAGDRVQLQQVLINLLMNGMQAMAPRGGALRLSLAPADLAGDAGVRIAVADEGPGIPADGCGRLFEPFYSTKQDGMGMGLPICRSIVEAHGGRIAVLPGGPGATLEITLPAHREAAA